MITLNVVACICSLLLCKLQSLQGSELYGWLDFSFPRRFVPGNETQLLDVSFLGRFVPWTIRSLIWHSSQELFYNRWASKYGV